MKCLKNTNNMINYLIREIFLHKWKESNLIYIKIQN